MKALHLMAMSAAMSALLIFAAAEAEAQQRPVGGGRGSMSPPSQSFLLGRQARIPRRLWRRLIVEREVPVIVEREVVREAQPADPPPAGAATAPPRKPYVIGSTYASLPGGCMKLIEDGVSYYYCGGEWYRQTGKLYRAVARKL